MPIDNDGEWIAHGQEPCVDMPRPRIPCKDGGRNERLTYVKVVGKQQLRGHARDAKWGSASGVKRVAVEGMKSL
jgi:hypothetical protein